MSRKLFHNKVWVFLPAAVAVLMLVLLSAGIGEMHFLPGRPIARSESATIQVSVEKIAAQIAEIPVWKQVLFWVLLFLLVLMVASMFSPELRRKIIQYFLRFSLFVLALFIILKNFRALFPGLNLGKTVAKEGGGATGGEAVPLVFRPPQISPTVLYLISLALILTLAGVIFMVWRRWLRKQHVPKGSQPLEDLAGIARNSLVDILAGRNWEDAIIQCYIRMSKAVGVGRGLQRRKDLTVSEFAVRLEEAGMPREAVWRLTRLFEARRYGDRGASREEMAEAVACLTTVMQACGVNE